LRRAGGIILAGRIFNKLAHRRAPSRVRFRGITNLLRVTRENWWAVTDSNRRHPACKADALPTELTALGAIYRHGTVRRKCIAECRMELGVFNERFGCSLTCNNLVSSAEKDSRAKLGALTLGKKV
jgi:hypothetical protein